MTASPYGETNFTLEFRSMGVYLGICDTYTIVKNKTFSKLTFNRAFYGLNATLVSALERKVHDDERLKDITIWSLFWCLMHNHIPIEVESAEDKLKSCKYTKREE